MNRSSFALLLSVAGCTGSAVTSTAAPADEGQRAATARPTIDRPHLATAGSLQYYGGPVIPNPKVYVVWWGDPAQLNPAITAASGGIADFFSGVTNSAFHDGFNQYNTDIAIQAGSAAGDAGTGQHLGRGNLAGVTQLAVPDAGSIADSDIQAALAQAFALGTLPNPDDNTLYALFFPSSVSITLDGSQSCGAYLAYHEAALATGTGHAAYYMVVPDCGSDFPGTCVTVSHELAEAQTDAIPTPGSNPNYPQAWNASDGEEAGDLCEGSGGTVSTALGTFSVQGIWDNLTQSCPALAPRNVDFSVALSPNSGSVGGGSSATFQVVTGATDGGQALALSATAPAGVTATFDNAAVTAGGTANLTVSAPAGTSLKDAQVVVSASGTGDFGPQIHTAALLLQVTP